MHIWTHLLPILLKQYSLRVDLVLSVRWCDIALSQKCRGAINHSRQASKEFPILLEYEGNWVAHDYLRTYLKNCSQRAKKDQQQKDKELEAAAKGKTKVCALLDLQ